MPITRLRRVIQVLFLCLFFWLLGKTFWPLQTPVPPQIFLRADPLSGIAVALSPYRSLQLLSFFKPALILLGLTLLFGRFFCGWICPLGTLIEAVDNLLRAHKRRRFHWPRGKYYVLGLVLISAVLGAQLFWILDPIALLTRTYALVFDSWGREAFNVAVPLLRSAGWRLQPLTERPFALALPTAIVFILIVLGGVWGSRFWCRMLCPLGALLGMAGRFGLWRRQATEACNACGLCVRSCPMHAIAADNPRQTRQAECIQCYACVPACARGASQMIIGRAPVASGVDISRREFVGAMVLGLSYGVLARTGLLSQKIYERLIRPPGAFVRDSSGAIVRLMSEEEFLSKCLRCGQCMKVCPTGGLQPAIEQAGWDGFYTPYLKPRVGFCEQSCVACGRVCPSGALLPFSPQEKHQIQMGEAHIHRHRCLSWRRGESYRECLVCYEHCSYGAIEIWEEEGQRRPNVLRHRCVGCGLCEHVCPVQPEAAIIVYRRQ